MYLAGLHATCNYESVYESGYRNNVDSTNYLVVIMAALCNRGGHYIFAL